ncbi:MAG: hypothetical protein K0Q50_219 [Vampirovibrio sp.]|jgi:hypothetical protein|nr:hypothetical protein [Vampirovibrio sp.]
MAVYAEDHRVKVESNYNKFKLIHNNRDINPSNVENLVKSIKKEDLSEYFPILVNSKMEIIDGQHRFHALKRLNLPIRYKVVKNAEPEMVAQINQNQKAWNVVDFIKFEAGMGNTNFQNLYADMQKYNMTHTSILGFILRDQNHNKKIKIKTLVYGPTQSNEVARFLKEVQIFKNLPFGTHRNFYFAFSKLRSHYKYDTAVMIHQASKYSSVLTPQVTREGYFEQLVYLYNYNRRGNKGGLINLRDFDV